MRSAVLCLVLSVAPLIRLATRRGPTPRRCTLPRSSHTRVKERSRRAVLKQGRRVEVLKIGAAGETRSGQYATAFITTCLWVPPPGRDPLTHSCLRLAEELVRHGI